MREILFRGKRVDNWEWIEGGYVKYNRKHYIISSPNGVIVDWIEVIPETVGQYTGMTDKNGNRIFEGDIVEGRDYDEEDGFGVVDWIEGAFYVHNDSWCGTFVANYDGHNFEVIGNIHDNPELIGGKDDA